MVKKIVNYELYCYISSVNYLTFFARKYFQIKLDEMPNIQSIIARVPRWGILELFYLIYV